MPLSVLLVYVGLAWIIGHFGENKKFGFWGNFAVALLTTPIVGLLVLFASDDKEEASA